MESTQEIILRLQRQGILELREPDSEEPEIWTHRGDRGSRRLKVRTMKKGRRRQPRMMLEVWLGEKKATICFARLVWILDRRSTIPDRFEIHHKDENYKNNAATNLFCLHYLDHGLFHRKFADEVF